MIVKRAAISWPPTISGNLLQHYWKYWTNPRTVPGHVIFSHPMRWQQWCYRGHNWFASLIRSGEDGGWRCVVVKPTGHSISAIRLEIFKTYFADCNPTTFWHTPHIMYAEWKTMHNFKNLKTSSIIIIFSWALNQKMAVILKEHKQGLFSIHIHVCYPCIPCIVSKI